MSKTHTTSEAPTVPFSPPGMPGTGSGPTPPGAPSDPLTNMLANMNGGAGNDIDAMLRGMDLSKIGDGGFALLTHGEEYEFWIKRAKAGKSSNQNPKISFILEVTEDYAEAGQVIADDVTLTEAAMWKFKSAARACGLLSDEGTFIGNGIASFINWKMKGKVKNEPWDGKLRSKIDGGWLEPDGGPQQRTGDGSSGPLPTALPGATPAGF